MVAVIVSCGLTRWRCFFLAAWAIAGVEETSVAATARVAASPSLLMRVPPVVGSLGDRTRKTAFAPPGEVNRRRPSSQDGVLPIQRHERFIISVPTSTIKGKTEFLP